MTQPQRPKQVALVLPVTVSWLAILADGVAQYAREHDAWDFTTSPPTLAESAELALTCHSLKGWPGDGAIAVITDIAEVRAARRLRIPVVCVNGNLRHCGVPRVMTDQYATGRMAADHLLQLGFPRLAYYGLSKLEYSRERQRGFVDGAAKVGVPCKVFNMPVNTDVRAAWHKRRTPLAQWLKTLDLPVGILAVHDYRARVLIDECVRLGLRVPHEVAVLGIDNDLTACEFCQPTLSSVSRATWKIGYEAARLLHQMMNGQSAPPDDILISPEGVVMRRSTDTVAVTDPHVSAAVHFMRDHIGEVFGVERVMEHVAVSRRRLHEQFQRLLGCPPYEYLCRLRVERAKQLLSVPQRVKIRQIAIACGFSSAARMRLVFQRVTGITPLAYHRLHGTIAAGKSPARDKAK
jgi:LacI family transcriptional regulator